MPKNEFHPDYGDNVEVLKEVIADDAEAIGHLQAEIDRLRRSMTDLVFAFSGVTLKDADDSLYEALEYQIGQLKLAIGGE